MDVKNVRNVISLFVGDNMKINITNHAMDRWVEYGQVRMRYTQLAAKVQKHFQAALLKGVRLRDNAVYVEINKDLFAVLVPGDYYGWDVLTFRLKRNSPLRQFYYEKEEVVG